MKQPETVSDVLADLDELARDNERVSIGAIVEAFGNRSYGPFILIPALIEITPIGGIPGLPTFLAVVIALVAVQILLGRSHLWLPGFIERLSVDANKLARAADKLQGLARFLDQWFHGRMQRFSHGPFPGIAAICILVLCCTVPPLEFVPFASTAPMLAIACFGLAIMVRDGLLMIIALTLSVLALGVGAALGSGLVGGSTEH